ncbi:hypothetical protein M422DRAFT_178917, partial [Sphaerobolus stellatus SS14]
DDVQVLQEELHKTKQEYDTLTSKYNTLVAKLSTMRSSVEGKLKRDAEELDRREQHIQHLNAQNADLELTVETLKDELIHSNSEAERSSRELESLRARILHEGANEAAREREFVELQSELERSRIERDEFEHALMTEKIVTDEVKGELTAVRRELDLEKEARIRVLESLEHEQEKCANLQTVLDDFQSAKEYETRQAVRELEDQLRQTTKSLAEYKSRALQAEVELQETSTNTQRTAALEKELKEKNLLIGKLRHEAVILNEHLTEAIRRLRKGASDTNVDRRLVTNVFLSFLTTPRADTKRYEMLSLLASILSWTDAEREKAGLQRTAGSSLLSRVTGRTHSTELERTDETESFSNMWVEFLLKEANQGSQGSASPTSIMSPAPKSPSLPSSPRINTQKMGRLASYSGTNLASATERTSSEYVQSPPPRKDSLPKQ